MRTISIDDFVAIDGAPDVGAAPMLQWVAIADLVVDDAYQRPIYGAGRTNVRRIATEFRWSKFAPVVVAPIAGGKFAIIDGQHRATAALLLGIDSIPAQVIIADTAEQAAAFKSINGQVTRMHALALHHAAIRAGDEAAKELESVAQAAGVEILRYPKPVEALKPGETLAMGSIREGLKAYGRETVITALTCVTETENNKPGVLAGPIVRALCSVLAGNVAWREGGGRPPGRLRWDRPAGRARGGALHATAKGRGRLGGARRSPEGGAERSGRGVGRGGMRAKPITYARVGGPPDDWHGLAVFDLETGAEILDVVEVDPIAGWVRREVRGADGQVRLNTAGDGVEIARLSGRFEIREPVR